MATTNPAQAINVVRRVEMMCDFMEHPAIRTAVEQNVPVTMPRAHGALGFDIPLWVGLGTVSLWAALDAFAERTALHGHKCKTCRKRCMPTRFAPYIQDNDGLSLEELEDIRHLYAHNYAGEADDEYFKHKERHVLTRGAACQLTCGATFDGQRMQLDLSHLRTYSRTVQSMLARIARQPG